jgi:hypothetical protein
VTIDGTGFAHPLGSLFTPNGYVGPLTPLSGGTASRIRIVVPAGVPTGPGALQVVNAPRFIASNAVSVPIGTGVRDHVDHNMFTAGGFFGGFDGPPSRSPWSRRRSCGSPSRQAQGAVARSSRS